MASRLVGLSLVLVGRLGDQGWIPFSPPQLTSELPLHLIDAAHSSVSRQAVLECTVHVVLLPEAGICVAAALTLAKFDSLVVVIASVTLHLRLA